MQDLGPFQSTRPARGATAVIESVERTSAVSIHAPRTGRDVCDGRADWLRVRFNPRAPHGARPLRYLAHLDSPEVSIHAPRTGRDASEDNLSRLITDVSIHAPRTGRDHRHVDPDGGEPSFNPRAPHGARQRTNTIEIGPIRFQSTRPARGATRGGGSPGHRRAVSIHAPRTGRDLCATSPTSTVRSFNPRAPHGARRGT